MAASALARLLSPEVSDAVVAGGSVAPDRVAALRALSWRAWDIEYRDAAMRRESIKRMRIGTQSGPQRLWPAQPLMRRGDGERPTRLARAFQVSKPSMTAAISRLAAKGCVTVTSDADDARAKRVRLTDKGRAAHAAARTRLDALQAELFSGGDVAALLEHNDAIAALRAHLDARRNARDGLGESGARP